RPFASTRGEGRGRRGRVSKGAPNGVMPLKWWIQQPGRDRSRLVSSFDADDRHCNEMRGESYAEGMGASSSSSFTTSESGARSLSAVAGPRHDPAAVQAKADQSRRADAEPRHGPGETLFRISS